MWGSMSRGGWVATSSILAVIVGVTGQRSVGPNGNRPVVGPNSVRPLGERRSPPRDVARVACPDESSINRSGFGLVYNSK